MAKDEAPLPVRHVAEEDDAGSRLDRFLASRIETQSRARLQELIRGGYVVREGDGLAVTDPAAKVRAGESFTVDEPAAEPYALRGEQIGLDVVYEDESIIVVNKPAGLVVHPGAGNQSGTLVNALLSHCGASLSGIGGVARPGIVHRLDKDTSGILVVAKTDAAHRGLARQFSDHGRTGELRREYFALVWGEPKLKAGRIETQIGRHPSSRTKMAVLPSGGRLAITNYKTERIFRLPAVSKGNKTSELSLSQVRCSLETGRTHQVRVHMAHLGTPIVGDATYGAGFLTKTLALPQGAAGTVLAMERQALHAQSLRFQHPVTGKIMTFEARLPEDIAKLCSLLASVEAKLSKN